MKKTMKKNESHVSKEVLADNKMLSRIKQNLWSNAKRLAVVHLYCGNCWAFHDCYPNVRHISRRFSLTAEHSYRLILDLI